MAHCSLWHDNLNNILPACDASLLSDLVACAGMRLERRTSVRLCARCSPVFQSVNILKTHVGHKLLVFATDRLWLLFQNSVRKIIPLEINLLLNNKILFVTRHKSLSKISLRNLAKKFFSK